MYKVAAVGDADSIAGLASIGMEIFTAYTAAEATQTLRELTEGDYAVVFITESVCSLIPEIINKYRSLPSPALIPIPGISGNTGYGMEMVSKSVEQAVGSDILK